MRLDNYYRPSWLVNLFVLVLMASDSAQNFFGDYFDDDNAQFLPAFVAQQTNVQRRKRSDYSTEERGSYAHWYDFPEKMTFTVNALGQNLVLNLTRSEYARAAVTISNENGKIESDFESRVGVYHSFEQGASVLVECEMQTCFLYGTLTFEGDHYHIEQDHSSTNLAFHTLRKKNKLEMEEMLKSMLSIPVEEDTSVGESTIRKRRSIPADCEIIEINALIDNTIWDKYLYRYVGDEGLAYDAILMYYRSTFAEVDFRFRCLTDYFTNYKGTCDVTCLRVVLVAIHITQHSSWTFGNFAGSYVKGYDGLAACGNINSGLSGSATMWDQLLCFTCEDLALYEGGQWEPYYKTAGYGNSMCNSDVRKRVSVHEAIGDGMDIAIAHSILYGICAPKDKTKTCSKNGYFLMREPQEEKASNPARFGQEWYLTNCTIGPVCAYIKGLSTNCMRVHGTVTDTIWDEWESTPLPGELFSTDEQCTASVGYYSVQCDPSGHGDLYPKDLCEKYMYCTKYGSCGHKVRVSSGTPCSPCAKICLKGKCVLIHDVPLGGICECHSQCAGGNSGCSFGYDYSYCGQCVCKDGYYDSYGNCTEKVPNGGDCDEDDQCRVEHSVCKDSTCQCGPDYYYSNGVCIKKSCLGYPCNSTIQCKGDHVVCDTSRDICVCEMGYFVDQTGKCVTFNGTLCDPCTQTPDSCTQTDTECGDDGFCICTSNTVEVDGECYGTKVDERCTNAVDTCTDEYADCIGGICACRNYFFWNGTICVGAYLCDPCDPMIHSCQYFCNPESYRCECPANQVQIGNLCYGTRVMEPCTSSLDTCTDYHADCNGLVCECVAGYSWNGSDCVGENLCDVCDHAIHTCLSPLICSPVTNKCQCPPDKVQIEDQCYGTRVTEECTTILDTCVDDYAECNGTFCTCEYGYQWNGSICVGSNLCDPCDPNTPSCDSSLVCSQNTYRCECPANLAQIGDACYGTRVNEPCTTQLNTCSDDNAICNGAVCQCVTDFAWNGSICVGSNICDPCDSDELLCQLPFVCNPATYRCECPAGRVQIEGICYGTLVTEVCSSSIDTCIDKNAECNGTVCDCMPGFTWTGSICVGPNLWDPCDPYTPSCDSSLVCNTNTYRCDCASYCVQIGDSCYGTRIGMSCTTDTDTCVDDNAECHGNGSMTTCMCKSGYFWTGSICVGQNLCDPCNPAVNYCSANLICNPNTYRCECPPHQVQIGDDCYGTRVTEFCTLTLDTCIDDNADCEGEMCKCNPGYAWNGTICVGPDLCDPCDSEMLTCYPDLVCSQDTYRCECPPDHIQIENGCYGTRVTEKCTASLNTCVDRNAECDGTVCGCKTGFTWNGLFCLGSGIWDTCNPLDSTCDPPLVCNPGTNTCDCPPGQLQIGDMCYGTRVTEPCTDTVNTCTDNNAMCDGTTCVCRYDFVWDGSTCLGPDLCDPCDPGTPSCANWLVCSPETLRCECPSFLVQIGSECYGTQILQPCTSSLDTCTADYSECDGSVCACQPGFTWNGCFCVGSDLCDPCDPNFESTCGDGLMCDYYTFTCACPFDQVQIGNACFGTRVTEECTTALDTCTDRNAECNGTVCSCEFSFIWNGSECVGPDLCDQCDPNTPSCVSGLVCSSETYRCECPYGHVQIGFECYGTHILEFCTTSLDTCIDDNAYCNDSVCACFPGFTWNGTTCHGPNLCDPCDPADEFDISCTCPLVCSSNTNRCQCPPDSVQIGDYCYGTRVLDECTTSLNTCTDKHAECNGTVCTCISGYTWTGSRCVGMELCDPCDPSVPCLPGLVCSVDTFRCECLPGHVQIGDSCYGRLVSENCNPSLDTCIDDGAECNGSTCDCISGSTWNEFFCAGPDLCDFCISSDECTHPLVCNPGPDRCECPQNQVQIGDACYGTRVTEPCTLVLNTCTDHNSVCNGTTCECAVGFIWNGSICGGPDLCDACDPLGPSTCEYEFVCSPDTYRCECPPDRVQIGGFCYGTRVLEVCTGQLNTCADDYSECNGSVCSCIAGFNWNGSTCVGQSLCDICDPGYPCASGLVCSLDTYRCECPTNQVQIGDNCYGTLVTEECTPALDTCTDDKAECNGTVCVCRAGFAWDGSICVGSMIDDPCTSDDNCTGILICNVDTSLCACPMDLVRVGDFCYGTLVGENCTLTLDTCTDKHAECAGDVCACVPEFVYNGSVCVGPNLCDPCDPFVCSCYYPLLCSFDTYRCECPDGSVQIGDDCYGTLVTEPCTNSLDTCIDLNAECNGTVCVCSPGFLWNDQICVGHDLCDPCDPSTPSCDSSLVCSSDTFRCECPSDRVQIGDFCFGTLVSEPCTPYTDTCTDDNAGCNGTVCDCLLGYVWNGTICVGSGICDPCDSNFLSCGPQLVCSPNSYRCECPPERVQVASTCYGTHVYEICTDDLNTCTDDNAICNSTSCVCEPGFIWNNSICVGPDLCDPCDPLTPSCDCDFVCSSDTYRCECPPGEVQIGDACYGTRVNDVCKVGPDTCIDANAGCNGSLCVCNSGFQWNGSICVGPNVWDPCDTSALPCDPGLECSTITYRCECPSNRVQIGDKCYGTRVNETCTTLLNTCTDCNAECDGTICDCKSGYIWNGSICAGENLCDLCDPAVLYCDSGLECSSETYRCECPSDRVQIGDACYGTHVTEPCKPVTDTCVDRNAECNGTECVCESGFVWNNSRCVGHDLCDPCDPDTPSCDLSLVCSPDAYRCECPPGHVQIGHACYGTRVNESCTSVQNTCVDSYAECNGIMCVCVAGFTWNGTICAGMDLCDPCDTAIACETTLVCSTETYRCECPITFVQIGDNCYGTQVGEPCTDSLNTCTDHNALCNGTFCNCVAGFSWNGSVCVGVGICDPCDPLFAPCDNDLVCSSDTYTCQCPPNQVQIGDVCYGRLHGETCTPLLDTCIDDNAMCNGACNCMYGFLWNGTICVGQDLCDPCDSSVLACDSSLVCSPDTYRCECPPDTVQIGDSCYGTRVTETCIPTLDVCIDDNAACNGSVCQCFPGFVWNDSICVGPDVCDPCDPSTPSCVPDLVCNPDIYRCECPANQVQVGCDCYGTRVTEPCTTSQNTCIDDNAECNGTVCDCKSGYIWNDTICVGPDLCDPCDPDTPSCDNGLVCSTNTYRCECPSNQVQIGNDCYGTRVTEACTVPDTCIDDNAECNGTVCECISEYTWNGSICVGQYLCDLCDTAYSVCALPLACNSDTDRCECPPGSVQIGDSCYGKRVTENCTTSLDTCIDDNAECDGAECVCITEFAWNGSTCVGPHLCDPCDSDTLPCDSGLVCSPETHRCECQPGEVQYGNACYGTRVLDPCTSDLNTCIDKHAECNGVFCECVSGYFWNGSICGGNDLCDQCDPNAFTCAYHLVCSPDTYRCECPPDQVQIGDACYGTHINDSCTNALDTCTDDNAGCNGMVCDCLPGYMWNGSLCVGFGLCDICDALVLPCALPFICGSDTFVCECPVGFVQIGDACYGRLVDEECLSTEDTCIDDNAICSGTPGVCTCTADFTWNALLEICVGQNLDEPCDSGSCGAGLVCGSVSNRCECGSPPLQIDNMCYGSEFGESCTTSYTTCTDEYAACIGGNCQCISGFIWNGTIGLCVGSELDDPCDAVSCLVNGLVCGSTGKCECPDGQVQLDNTCVSLICGPCADDSDCIGANMECVNGECRCITDFYLNNCSICQQKIANNQTCESDDQCLSNHCICEVCQASDEDDCCNDCDETRADIVFITDNSGSVGEANYEIEKNFVISLANEFDVSENNTRIGLVDYARLVNLQNTFEMDEYLNNLDLTAKIASNSYTGGGTRTDLAIMKATEFFGTSANRPGIKNFAVVITDGGTNSGGQGPPLENAVNDLQAVPDMTVISVGIGSSIDLAELELIASNPDLVFLSTDFDALDEITAAILQAICNPENGA